MPAPDWRASGFGRRQKARLDKKRKLRVRAARYRHAKLYGKRFTYMVMNKSSTVVFPDPWF